MRLFPLTILHLVPHKACIHLQKSHENHDFSQLCFEPHHFRNMVAKGTRTVKDSKVEPLLWGHRSPWACLNTCLDSVPCSPAAEQLGPAATRSWGWSIFELGSWLVSLGGSTGSHGGLIVNYPQASTWLLLWWCQIKESPCPLLASAALSHLRKCSSSFSLHSDRIFKSWGNQKYIADVLQRLQTARQGGSWSPTNMLLFCTMNSTRVTANLPLGGF